MEHNRILVTGATGMVGRVVVPLLVKQGYQVRVLIENGTDQSLLVPTVEPVFGDITEHGACLAASREVDAIVHLAGRAHTRSNPELFFAVNTEGTRNLVKAAGANQVRHFIFISSSGVYGDGQASPFEETDELCPKTPYGHSKLLAEQIVVEAPEQLGVTYTILRPSVVYGPHDRGNVLRMIKAIDRGLFAVVGDGSTRKSMTFVENLADVIALCLRSPAALNQTFNVADPNPYKTGFVTEAIAGALGKKVRLVHLHPGFAKTAADFLEHAFRLLGRRPIVSRRDISVLETDMVLGVGKLEAVLGYRSAVPLLEGLERTLTWYKTVER